MQRRSAYETIINTTDINDTADIAPAKLTKELGDYSHLYPCQAHRKRAHGGHYEGIGAAYRCHLLLLAQQ